ncbi:MAG: hypothetical protein SO160_01675 [Lachnospiraceae bacterium]|nr:hypothetical protein [Lachnospiraceae bacterium]
MEEKIKALYENINFIGYYCMSHRKYDYVEKAKSLFPAISEFVEWFMAGNQFGIEEEVYWQLQENLLGILNDMETAFKEQDRVLMLDALESGISEYLVMFLPEEYFMEQEENVRERTEI